MKFNSSVMIFCWLSVIECILQGKQALEGDFTYQVSIRNRDDYNRHIGGGAIITPLLILTSASVVYFVLCPKSIYVAIGTIYLDVSGTFIEIKRCTIHPSFEYGKIANDIALLHTAGSIVFNKIIQPVRLPWVGMPIKRMVKVNASGWGRYNKIRFF